MRPAEIRSYRDLLLGLRARKAELDISMITVNSVAGLTPGHASKLLSLSHLKGLGDTSLPLLLGALGLRLLLVEDKAQLRRVRGRLVKRKPGRREIEASPAAPAALAPSAEQPAADRAAQRERCARLLYADPPEMCG